MTVIHGGTPNPAPRAYPQRYAKASVVFGADNNILLHRLGQMLYNGVDITGRIVVNWEPIDNWQIALFGLVNESAAGFVVWNLKSFFHAFDYDTLSIQAQILQELLETGEWISADSTIRGVLAP